MMVENNGVNIGSLLAEGTTRTILFNNYRIINKHIPECAHALEIYKDNIMSPDDFTKLIFNVNYNRATNVEVKEIVEKRLSGITTKYELEDKCDKIIGETLLLGESYQAVLSLEDEMNSLLNKTGILNESTIRTLDKNVVDTPVLSESLTLNENEVSALNELYNTNEETKLDDKSAASLIAKLVNERVEIGSSREFLLERMEADKQLNEETTTDINISKKKKKTIKEDQKALGVNGSVIRYLVPEKLIELKIDNICYGYYYCEESTNTIATASYLGTASGRNANGIMNLNQNNTFSDIDTSQYTPAGNAASYFDIGEEKLKLISNLFLNAISKKINRKYIRNNKQFKDYIYDLLRQDYIIKKGIKLTYFTPEEVIKFTANPIYKDITFFAKLYLSVLTNNLLIKLGRSHDKRVFYVNVGADAAYEQAIQTVIQDIKTKDYKMEQLNDFNTVLNLAPGRFDDYFMPTVNGDKPIEIDTLQGMDVDMNNEFVEYLKNSMMSGMGVPRNLIDVTSEVDYARSISAMNSNFVRSVIKYQKALAPSFTRMYQILYRNEYRFSEAGSEEEINKDTVDISAIEAKFPSPATLAMTNMTEQIQAVDSNADFIASQLIPVKQDGSTEDQRVKLKTEIVKDLMPGIDWKKYKEMIEDMKVLTVEDNLNNPPPADPNTDPYGGAY